MNAHYFGGLHEEGPKTLWEEVDRYIRNHYDTAALKKVYIHGDGAPWIWKGRDYVGMAEFVLDKFHMHKYIIRATSHLLDSADDARSEIYRAIHKKKKWMAEDAFNKILAVTEGESKRKAVQASKDYILNNWRGIMASLKDKEHQTGCSAEGHVSHVLSDRLSSRPLGWSRTGVDKMARVYRRNGGDLLELVRCQWQEAAAAVGAETEKIYLSSQIIASEKNRWGDIGKYYEAMRCTFAAPESRKQATILYHEWF